MAPLAGITDAFASRSLELVRDGSVFRVMHSASIPARVVLEIISSAKYCPLLSQNRNDGDLEFSVVPYKKQPNFERADCEKTAMTAEALWKSIEATTSLVRGEDDPIIIRGKQIFPSLREAKQQMVTACTRASSLMVEFLDRAPRGGKALDIGCGSGVNSIPLLAKGWHVIAIDRSDGALATYQQAALAGGVNYLKNGQLRLIKGDITTQEFPPDRFDLVICVDVLPYIASKEIRRLMDKIHQSLVLDGQFFGTVFFAESTTQNLPVEMLAKLGAHFYPGAHIAPALLEYTGFYSEECILRLGEDGVGIPPNCVQFRARKKV